MRTVWPTGGMLLNSFLRDVGADERHAPALFAVLGVDEPAVAGRLGAHQRRTPAPRPRTPAVVDRVP